MNLATGLLVAWLIAGSSTVGAASIERVLWDKRPIPVHIQTGQERIVHFPGDVRYWLPDSIKQKTSVLAANGVLYIRALKPFPSTRIRVQDLNDQQVFLLDISASSAELVSDELIVMTKEGVTNRSKPSENRSTVEDWRIQLTRHAARQLYAPERFASGRTSIKRIPLAVTSPIPLIRGGVLEATPIASWHANGLTVTAITLRNLSARQYGLKFEHSTFSSELGLHNLIRGHWLTATLQHASIGPSGQEDEVTTLYLVSERPFLESLNWLSPDPVKKGEPSDG